VLWNWVAFAAVAAWLGRDIAEYPNAGTARQIAASHPAVPDAYHVLYAAGVVGLAATAVAAVPFAIAAARYARAHGNRRTFALMAVPPVVAAAWLGVLRAIALGSSSGGHFAFGVIWLLLGLAGIAASTQAVCVIIRTTEFNDRVWRLGTAAAAAITAAMLVATGATITWGLVFRTSQPHPGDATGWLAVAAIMAVTTARAVIALIGTRRTAAQEPAVA
jgi:hypothetical protein